MSASYPPLPDEIVELVQGGVSLLIGTCSDDLVPECVRAVGLRVHPCKCRLTVLIPQATGATAVTHLRQNGRLAVTMAQIPTHRSLQLKGKVSGIREGGAEDRALSDRYVPSIRASLAYIGIPEGVTQGITNWPLWAIDLDIELVYAQTPGPVAGAKMPLPEGTA